MADGIRTSRNDLAIKGQALGYGKHQSVQPTPAAEILNPLVYLISANAPGLKEATALFRRSLIKEGVITLENLMSLRVSTPLTKNEIDTALAAMPETFVVVYPIIKEVSPHLIG